MACNICKGGDWKSEVVVVFLPEKKNLLFPSFVFFPEVVDYMSWKKCKPVIKVYDSNNTKALKALLKHECIRITEYVKTKLFSWQLTQLLLCHNFLIMKTENWWWSIEKLPTGILMQRGRVRDDVAKFQYDTTAKELMERTCSPKTTETVLWGSKDSSPQLFKIVKYLKYQMKEKYHWWEKNCKAFVSAWSCFRL